MKPRMGISNATSVTGLEARYSDNEMCNVPE
jgi:hypothetical protein